MSTTVVGGPGLAFLPHVGHLRRLRLQRTRITDEQLTWLGALVDLEELDLSNTRITGSSLGATARPETPRASFSLDSTQISDAALQELAKLPNLEAVSLANDKITDPGLKQFQSFPALRFLNLNHTRITDDGLSNLVKLTRLRGLNVVCPEFGRNAGTLIALHRHCPILKSTTEAQWICLRFRRSAIENINRMISLEPLLAKMALDGFVVLRGVYSPAQIEAMLAGLAGVFQDQPEAVATRSNGGNVFAARNVLALWPTVGEIWRQPPLPEILARLLGHELGLTRALFFDKPPERRLDASLASRSDDCRPRQRAAERNISQADP